MASDATNSASASPAASQAATPEFIRLISLHQPQVFAYIYTLLPHWDDAQEVLQETSVVLWKSFDSFQLGTNFRAWAFQTAFHQVLAFRKRKKRLPLPLGDAFLEAVSQESETLAGSLQDQVRALQGCVGKLSTRDADVLRRCYLPGATTKLVAEQLGRPAGTVYKSLTRIRRALFACIQRTLAMEAR